MSLEHPSVHLYLTRTSLTCSSRYPWVSKLLLFRTSTTEFSCLLNSQFSSQVNSLLAKFNIWQMYQSTHHQLRFLEQTLELHIYCRIITYLFSSPEPKARVSYCRPFSSVVRRPSSVNFLHFHLLLENAWLDFNQTWQESSLGVGDSKLFK